MSFSSQHQSVGIYDLKSEPKGSIGKYSSVRAHLTETTGMSQLPPDTLPLNAHPEDTTRWYIPPTSAGVPDIVLAYNVLADENRTKTTTAYVRTEATKSQTTTDVMPSAELTAVSPGRTTESASSSPTTTAAEGTHAQADTRSPWAIFSVNEDDVKEITNTHADMFFEQTKLVCERINASCQKGEIVLSESQRTHLADIAEVRHANRLGEQAASQMDLGDE